MMPAYPNHTGTSVPMPGSWLIRRSSRLLRYYYLKLLRQKADPRILARGAAIGCFVGITPTLPLHTVQLFLLAKVFRANFLASFVLASIVSNPLTFAAQYYLCWHTGQLLLGSENNMPLMSAGAGQVEPGWSGKFFLAGQFGQDALCTALVGGYVLALPMALLGYFLTYRFCRKNPGASTGPS